MESNALPTREWLQQNAILYASHDDGYAWAERYYCTEEWKAYAVISANNETGYIVKEVR